MYSGSNYFKWENRPDRLQIAVFKITRRRYFHQPITYRLTIINDGRLRGIEDWRVKTWPKTRIKCRCLASIYALELIEKSGILNVSVRCPRQLYTRICHNYKAVYYA